MDKNTGIRRVSGRGFNPGLRKNIARLKMMVPSLNGAIRDCGSAVGVGK